MDELWKIKSEKSKVKYQKRESSKFSIFDI